jgi:hypothetical protein
MTKQSLLDFATHAPGASAPCCPKHLFFVSVSLALVALWIRAQISGRSEVGGRVDLVDIGMELIAMVGVDGARDEGFASASLQWKMAPRESGRRCG